MDNESLLLSSMHPLVMVSAAFLRSLYFGILLLTLGFVLQLLQKCQTRIERLDVAEARAAGWAAEREELQASLAAKESMLIEEASRNAGLVADLEEAQVLVEHLREELKEEET